MASIFTLLTWFCTVMFSPYLPLELCYLSKAFLCPRFRDASIFLFHDSRHEKREEKRQRKKRGQQGESSILYSGSSPRKVFFSGGPSSSPPLCDWEIDIQLLRWEKLFFLLSPSLKRSSLPFESRTVTEMFVHWLLGTTMMPKCKEGRL